LYDRNGRVNQDKVRDEPRILNLSLAGSFPPLRIARSLTACPLMMDPGEPNQQDTTNFTDARIEENECGDAIDSGRQTIVAAAHSDIASQPPVGKTALGAGNSQK
jgi:hypothetical protein